MLTKGERHRRRLNFANRPGTTSAVGETEPPPACQPIYFERTRSTPNRATQRGAAPCHPPIMTHCVVLSLDARPSEGSQYSGPPDSLRHRSASSTHKRSLKMLSRNTYEEHREGSVSTKASPRSPSPETGVAGPNSVEQNAVPNASAQLYCAGTAKLSYPKVQEIVIVLSLSLATSSLPAPRDGRAVPGRRHPD
jgi:hypothetical protein